VGLITNIDANGRIQLPLAIRYGLNLCSGDKIVVDQLGDGTIILKKIEDDEILNRREGSQARMKEAAHS
jgi:AbrB family looped-hinge helix DNA binding protein